WYAVQGLAEDVRYYGQWMQAEAKKRIGHLYPKAQLPQEYGGGEATVVAWLWARTVKCPNPACGCQMPLVRTFELSKKKGKVVWWVEPVIDRNQMPPAVRFEVRTGKGEVQDGTMNRRGATCICCGTPVPFEHIRSEGKAGRMGAQLMVIVAEGKRTRLYLSPNKEHQKIATQTQPGWKPEAALPNNTRDIRPQLYGMPTYGDLFSSRQLFALNTFSDLVNEARNQAQHDAVVAGMLDENLSIGESVTGAIAYADAVGTYLALNISKVADRGSTLTRWMSSRDSMYNTFARQALPIVWDYVEVNPIGEQTGGFAESLRWTVESLEATGFGKAGFVQQADATTVLPEKPVCISTDPPYYDNIGYADLSDFFYIWLRRSLNKIYPNILGTLLTPKTQELVAASYRFGGDVEKARQFFEKGLGQAFTQMHQGTHSDYPVTVYYAFKQSETDSDGSEDEKSQTKVASTGWETMLEGLLKAGFQITGTWPMRTERSVRSIGLSSNALASSIVLVCRPRPESAPSTTRRQFLTTLKRELPEALKTLQQGNIAPVDLAQASIGPGMAVFSRYAKVLEADGTPMRVRTALQLINQTLDEFLTEQEGEFDADTRWALTWFEQHQFDEGKYGDAETLSKAKNTSVTGLENSGILKAKGGKVQLLRRDELPDNWTPEQDDRTPNWEVTQHLIWTLDQKGESGASVLLSKLGDHGEVARDLAYRLYSICDRKGWTQEAIAYNSLVISWPEISRLAAEEHKQPTPVQGELEF
ncbi:MAG: DUF1156 domain-containing protein, partial [Coleofasciculus sp. Co-bin14]|nr:DUF1156 domain-containing protein [Coleofasciculus sp. Co-bin14]